MDILSLVNQACIRAKEPRLNSLFLDDDSSLEWLGYTEQAANRIFSAHEWSRTTKDYSFAIGSLFSSFVEDGSLEQYLHRPQS